MAYRKKQPEEEAREQEPQEQEPQEQEKPLWDRESNPWYQTAAQLLETLQNRPAFSYDPGADPLYLGARDQHLRQGRRAMEDVMGQSTARTGGFSSTFAQNQGQQAYDRQMEQFAQLLPDFYDRARTAYDSETKELKDLLGAVTGMYDLDYQAWLDKVNLDREDAQDALDAEHWLMDFDRDNDHWQQEFEQQLQQWEAEFDRDQEHWEAQQQGSADSQDQAQQARERSYAYRMAMLALQHGLRVSDKLLQAAGIDKAYAELIRQYYATHGGK